MNLSPKKFENIREIFRLALIDPQRIIEVPDGFNLKVDSESILSFQYVDEKDLAHLLKEQVDKKVSGDHGLIIEKLGSNTKRNLEALKISYITLDGDFCIYYKQRVIRSGRSKPPRANIKNLKAINLLNSSDIQAIKSELPAPTDFISPYGLEILDVIFRLTQNDLEKMNPYSLCKKFNLNHSRLFRMQSSLSTKNLYTFKQIIKKLPREWWKLAYTYPRTHQRLRSFQRNAQHYTSLTQGEKDIDAFLAVEKTRTLYGEHAVVYGPIESLKRLGFFSTDETELWVVGDDALKEIKQLLRLTPATLQKKGPPFTISTLQSKEELSKQCIMSLAPQLGDFDSEARAVNFFRMIWDNCNADSRAQTAALDFLKEGILK